MYIVTKRFEENSFEQIKDLIETYEKIKDEGLPYRLIIVKKKYTDKVTFVDMNRVFEHALNTSLNIIEQNIEAETLPIELEIREIS